MKILILSIVSAFVLASCSTQKILHLKPIASETRWIDGREAIKQEKNGLKIVTAYDGMFEKYLTFDTEITNTSEHGITVTPSDFYTLWLNSQNDSLRDDLGRPQYFYALDPVEKAQQAQQQLKAEEARYKRASIFNLLFAVGTVVVAATTKSDNNSDAIRKANIASDLINLTVAKQAIDQNRLITQSEKLHYEKGNWQAETFRKTSLAPGQSIRGRVYVIGNEKAAVVKLHYPFANDNFVFVFGQSVDNNSY
jgi:hypothetical protein